MIPTMDRITGLVLSGGGARAAYQVGVLEAIVQIRREGRAAQGNPFPIVCGTSAGAVNAAAIACGADDFEGAVANLADIWRNFDARQVYRAAVSDAVTSGARWLSLLSLGWLFAQKRLRPRSLLDNAPLRALIEDRIALERLPQLMAGGHLESLAITASSYSTGEHVTFFQSAKPILPWSRNQRVSLPSRIEHAHLLASAAIPFVFPAESLDGPSGRAYFGDGAIRQTAPIAPAIHLGAHRILVIGAGRMVEPVRQVPVAAGYPSMAQIAGHTLSSIFLDALAVDVERLRRINQTLALIPPERREATPLRQIDVLLIAPSQRLDALAARHADALPATVSRLLRVLGATVVGREAQGSALMSYLLFEAAYTRELMALGFADALAQQEAIKRFFGWDA